MKAVQIRTLPTLAEDATTEVRIYRTLGTINEIQKTLQESYGLKLENKWIPFHAIAEIEEFEIESEGELGTFQL